MLFCQFYGCATFAAAAVGSCLAILLRFFEAVRIKMAQDFQNDLIRKLNIYDLSKWKINYLSVRRRDVCAQHNKNLSTMRNFAFGTGFH